MTGVSMPADVPAGLLQRALGELWQDVSRNGWADPQPLAVIVAQMLALAHAPPELEAAVEFLGGHHELTADAWVGITRELMNLDTRLGNAASGVEALGRNLPPGTLERVRRRLLDTGVLYKGVSVPWPWFRAILDLARNRQPAFPTLSQEALLLIGACVDVRSDDRVYCAYAGAADIGLLLAAERRVHVDLDLQEPSLAALFAWLAAAGDLQLDVRLSDPLESLAREQTLRGSTVDSTTYDVAIVNGPFSERHDRRYTDDLWRNVGLPSSSNLEGLHILLAALRGRRTAACITLDSFLFRTTGADQALKEQVIREHGLDTVVTLPRGAFGRYTSVLGSMLLFHSSQEAAATTHERGVLMVDSRREANRGGDAAWAGHTAQLVHTRTEGDTAILVPLSEIAAQDFNITVERYVLGADARRARDMLAGASVPLDDIAELYRPQALLLGRDRGSDPALRPYADESEALLEVGVADIDEAGIVRRPTKQVPATRDVIQRARRARLEAGDVLLVIKGSVGKVGFVRETPEGETWLASQSFAVLKLRRHGPISDPRVLFRFLSSSLGQGTIQSLKGGTIPGLQMNDVRRLPILLPAPETQVEIAWQVQDLFEIQDSIERLRGDLARRQRTIWPDAAEDHATDGR
jgi:N-6 DNA Methylase/Type I restriction modification DNA specificity domain